MQNPRRKICFTHLFHRHSSPSTTSSVLQSGSLKKMAGRPLLLAVYGISSLSSMVTRGARLVTPMQKCLSLPPVAQGSFPPSHPLDADALFQNLSTRTRFYRSLAHVKVVSTPFPHTRSSFRMRTRPRRGMRGGEEAYGVEDARHAAAGRITPHHITWRRRRRRRRRSANRWTGVRPCIVEAE